MDNGNFCRTWDYSIWRSKELEGGHGSHAQIAAERVRASCGSHSKCEVIMVALLSSFLDWPYFLNIVFFLYPLFNSGRIFSLLVSLNTGKWYTVKQQVPLWRMVWKQEIWSSNRQVKVVDTLEVLPRSPWNSFLCLCPSFCVVLHIMVSDAVVGSPAPLLYIWRNSEV